MPRNRTSSVTGAITIARIPKKIREPAETFVCSIWTDCWGTAFKWTLSMSSTDKVPRYRAMGRTMNVTPSAVTNADNKRAGVNPKAVRQLVSRPRTIICTTANIVPYTQSEIVKFTDSLCTFIAASPRSAASRLEKIPTNSSVNSSVIAMRKSISFQGFSDNMVSSYTGGMNVTMEKVLAGLLSVASSQLSFRHAIPAQLNWKCACLRGGTLPRAYSPGRRSTDN